MQRGEKRSMPPDNTPDDNAPSPTAPAAKKAKLPDFDWRANNLELTWRLVNELVKPGNKPVLFPEIEGVRVRASAYLYTASLLTRCCCNIAGICRIVSDWGDQGGCVPSDCKGCPPRSLHSGSPHSWLTDEEQKYVVG